MTENELKKLVATETKKYEFDNFEQFYCAVITAAGRNPFRVWCENGTTCVDVGEAHWYKIKGDYVDYFCGRKQVNPELLNFTKEFVASLPRQNAN